MNFSRTKRKGLKRSRLSRSRNSVNTKGRSRVPGKRITASKKIKSGLNCKSHARSRWEHPRETRFFCGHRRNSDGILVTESITWSAPFPEGSHDQQRRLSRLLPSSDVIHSLVRMRPVLASNDRNRFIVEAREMKKASGDQISDMRRVDDEARLASCESGSIVLLHSGRA